MINTLLQEQSIQIVLVDVGASGEPPTIWKQIGTQAIYVGFDPDEREMREIHSDLFAKHIIINQAVMPSAGDVTFYLTQSPYCSSTLEPYLEKLQDYIYSDLFVVTDQTTVPATTLDDVVTSYNLGQIDWLKTDSQGIDLQIYKSLSESLQNKVLAIDVEPGLLRAYKGEDLFPEVHLELLNNGFWLSDLETRGTTRMTRQSLHTLKLDEELIKKASKMAPGWLEARYLRTLDWLQEQGMGQREYIVLFVFALLDGHLGYGLDIMRQYQQLFGRDIVSQRAIAYTRNQIEQRAVYKPQKPSIAQRVKNKLKYILT
ncbi:MAG: FkbM family methyltransferase [Chloroflexota bacterium]